MSQSASSAAAPPSISEKATRPDVLWVNHKDQILIKVVVARASDVQCTFDKKAFTVICKSKESGSKIYGVSYGLFASIDAARCSFEVLADCIDVRLQKLGTAKVTSAEDWPRLTTEAIKSPKIQIDWCASALAF
jgi:hypothetical protein